MSAPQALPGFEGVIKGRHDGQRRKDDYYATPAWVADLIVSELQERMGPGGWVLEPGCGHGAIALPLAKAGYRVMGIDLRPEAVAELNRRPWEKGCEVEARMGDFLNLVENIHNHWGSRPAAVVGNPPFCHAQAFIAQSFELVAERGVVIMLLPLSFLATQDRAQFWRNHPADVLVLDRRPDFTGEGGANAEYGIYSWPPADGIGRIKRIGVQSG